MEAAWLSLRLDTCSRNILLDSIQLYRLALSFFVEKTAAEEAAAVESAPCPTCRVSRTARDSSYYLYLHSSLGYFVDDTFSGDDAWSTSKTSLAAADISDWRNVPSKAPTSHSASPMLRFDVYPGRISRPTNRLDKRSTRGRSRSRTASRRRRRGMRRRMLLSWSTVKALSGLSMD
jgi:hypothetical protein